MKKIIYTAALSAALLVLHLPPPTPANADSLRLNPSLYTNDADEVVTS